MPAGDKHRVYYDQALNDHSLAALRARLTAAAKETRTRVALHPASRIAQWQRLLDELDTVDRRTVVTALAQSLQRRSWQHPYKAHFRALLECRSFVEIIEQLLPDLSEADLRDLISGPLDPTEERAKSRARDREFELFVAAICRHAKCRVQLTEPDLLCTTCRGTWAMAAKRVSSRKRVRENVSRAAKQISQSGHLGFAFLDVTRLLEPRYEYIMHWRRDSGFLAGKMLAFVHREHSAAFKRANRGLLCGVVLRAVFPLLSQGLRLGTHETWHAVAIPGIDGTELNLFLQTFLHGLKGV